MNTVTIRASNKEDERLLTAKFREQGYCVKIAQSSPLWLDIAMLCLFVPWVVAFVGGSIIPAWRDSLTNGFGLLGTAGMWPFGWWTIGNLIRRRKSN